MLYSIINTKKKPTRVSIFIVIIILTFCCEAKNYKSEKIRNKNQIYLSDMGCEKKSEKKYIPRIVLKLLDKHFGRKFKIANPDEYEQVNLTDAHVIDLADTTHTYDKILNFVLLCNQYYLISFDQGGFTRTHTIAYFSKDTLRIYENAPQIGGIQDFEQFINTSYHHPKFILVK